MPVQVDLRGAGLRETDLTGAFMSGVLLDKAKFNEKTLWLDGFDPEKAGARLVEE